MCFSASDGLRGGWSIHVVSDFVTLHLTDIYSCSGIIASSCAHLCKPGSPMHDIAPSAPGRFSISDPRVLELSSPVCVCVHTFSMLDLFSGPSHVLRPVLARKLYQHTIPSSILLRAQRMATNGWEDEPVHSSIVVNVSKYIVVFYALSSECNVYWTSSI